MDTIPGVRVDGYLNTMNGLMPVREVSTSESIMCYFGRGVIGAQRLKELVVRRIPRKHLIAVQFQERTLGAMLNSIHTTRTMKVAAYTHLTPDKTRVSRARADFIEAAYLEPNNYVVTLCPGSMLAIEQACVARVNDKNYTEVDPEGLIEVAQLVFGIATPFFYNGVLVSEECFNGR